MPTAEQQRRIEAAIEGVGSAPADTEIKTDATKYPPSRGVALLTGGQDRHYAVGLGTALMELNVGLEVIGGDEIDGPEFQRNMRVRFRNLHGSQQSAGLLVRVRRILAFYIRLLQYVAIARPKIFHILWNNKLQIFDRTLLMLLYKLVGKRVVLTVHNVNAGRRDRRDSWLNRITLKFQYQLADHLFVHTSRMKDELIADFDVRAAKITTIPYGINNAVPFTNLTRNEARQELGLQTGEKVILFFGAIKQYKGLEYLVAAFQKIARQGDYRLIIAGERKKDYEEYCRSIQQTIDRDPSQNKVLQKIEFIPDAETEIYFKAADVAVLPYTEIFQSGILFLAFSFGLPVIATDVGSFAADIIQGETGFVCKPRDSEDLAATIQLYFESDLYKKLDQRRQGIRDDAIAQHSWDAVAERTLDVYSGLIERAR